MELKLEKRRVSELEINREVKSVLERVLGEDEEVYVQRLPDGRIRIIL